MRQISPRQVHLDFHTSELMPDIGLNFDPEQFARTAKEAAVSSMTVFARGHHGMIFYDSKKNPERVHPNLKRKNLMVDEVRALHSVGISAPVYIKVKMYSKYPQVENISLGIPASATSALSVNIRITGIANTVTKALAAAVIITVPKMLFLTVSRNRWKFLAP